MNLVKNPIQYYDMISVPVLAGSTQTVIPFPDQPLLRNKKISSITNFTQADLPYDINGVPVLNTTNAYLVLYYEGYENVHKIPLLELRTISSGNTGGAIRGVNFNGTEVFKDLVITWTKCYVEVPVAVAPGANTVFLFGVQYKYR